MCDSHCSTGIGQGHQGENIQEEIRAAMWFWKVAAHVPFLNMWPQVLPFYPEMLPLLNSQFPGKSSVSNPPPHQHLFISTTQLLLTVFICISPLSALLMLNEAQDSQMWCSSLRGSFGNQRSPHKSCFPDWDPETAPLFVSLQESSGDSWEIPTRWAWGYLQLWGGWSVAHGERQAPL